jgi:metal-dependent amidase/aminoacylase/carboxypeptidase family protein
MRLTCFFLTAVACSAASLGPSASDIDSLYPRVEALYIDLHSNPELAFEEKQSAAKLAGILKTLGYEVTTGVGGTGVVGLLKNGTGPVVMLRTELDALPVTEQTGLPFASKKAGVMHACGHDIHIALGRARRSGWPSIASVGTAL